jgi:hypothetical protein
VTHSPTCPGSFPCLEEPGGEERAALFVGAYLGAPGIKPGQGEIRRAQLYLIAERMMVWEYFHRPGVDQWPHDPDLKSWLSRYLEAFRHLLSRES